VLQCARSARVSPFRRSVSALQAASLTALLAVLGSCGGSPAAPTPATAAGKPAGVSADQAGASDESNTASTVAAAIGAVAGSVPGGPAAPAACVSGLSVSVTKFGGKGGTTTASVFAASSCQWHAYSDQGFVTVPTDLRMGNGSFTVTVSESTDEFPREALIIVNNQSRKITQSRRVTPPPPPPADAAAYLAVVGEDGDYITGGRNRIDTRSNAAFEATVDTNRTTVTVHVEPADGTWWYLRFSAPAGTQLKPGTYENVARWPFYKPGLDYSGDGRGCNQLSGRFVIHEAVFSGASTVERLRMSFEQHCEMQLPGAYGELALAAPYGPSPHTPAPPGHPPSPTPGTTTFALSSDVGDYIGQGQSATYTLANALFTVVPSASGITVGVKPSSSNSSWTLDLRAPEGLQLLPGIYEAATRYPFQSPVAPGLSFSGMGRGCNTLTGRFVVYEAQYGAGGIIDRFRATFEQHCEGGHPAARGDITIIGTPPR
jgi:hypothetical protein